jgi:calcineurin-like phosphoesterase family protein
MNETIVANHNKIVSEDDLLYHLGDFCFKGTNNAKNWENRLNGDIVHIKGNHDANNSTKTCIISAIMEFGNLTILAQHHPPASADDIPDGIDMVICGHVHDHYLYKILKDNPIPIINVGLDVHNFQPIGIDSLIKLYNKIKFKYMKDGEYGEFKR